MSIKIAICDDTAEDIRLLTNALYAYDDSLEVSAYTNGAQLIDALMDFKTAIDILLLDIYMPGLNGIETAQKICNERNDIKVIFITSSKEHFQQAYEVFAFNYILKPFDTERLHGVLKRAIEELRSEHSCKVHFSYRSTDYNVDCRDILYIESRDKILLFYLVSGKTLKCYGKLDQIMKELPNKFFIRCHQSFAVNTTHVTEFGKNTFTVGSSVIGISKKYLILAKDQYYAYLFARMGRGKL